MAAWLIDARHSHVVPSEEKAMQRALCDGVTSIAACAKVRRMVIPLAVAAACAVQPAFALETSDLYGVWQGTWFVDEWFTSTGAPLPVPSDADAALEFRLHPFDASAGNYGDVFIEGAVSGKVTHIEVSGVNVTMEITYPLMGVPEPRGFISSSYSAGWLYGDYDEQPPLPPGWIGWRGPFELQLTSPVPELPAVWTLGFGAWLIGLAARMRRGQGSGGASSLRLDARRLSR
jgi:hypothetical protein